MNTASFKESLISLIEGAVRVIFSIVFIAALMAGSYAGALIALIGAVLSLNSSREKHLKLTRDETPTKAIVTAGALMLALSVGLASFAHYQDKEEERKTAEAQAAAAASVADQKAKAVAVAAAKQAQRNKEFLANKDAVVSRVNDFLAQGRVGDAKQAIAQITVNDPELDELKASVELAQIREALKAENSLSLAQRVALYEQLVKLTPEDKKASTELKKLSALAKTEKEESEIEAAIQEQVKTKISGWDGSHVEVERAIKASMNNPKSYEHVKTEYWRAKPGQGGLVVRTVFRGTNAFGGVVPNTAVAHTDIYGHVLTLEIER